METMVKELSKAIHERCLGPWEIEPYNKEINHEEFVHEKEAIEILANLRSHWLNLASKDD